MPLKSSIKYIFLVTEAQNSFYFCLCMNKSFSQEFGIYWPHTPKTIALLLIMPVLQNWYMKFFKAASFYWLSKSMNLVFPLPIFWSHSLKTIRHSKKQLINANFPYLVLLITQITKKKNYLLFKFLVLKLWIARFYDYEN